MTASFRVTCPTVGDLPPAYQLRAWAAVAGPVELRLPPVAVARPGAKAAVVARLAAALPGFRVADGGGDHTHEVVTVAPPG